MKNFPWIEKKISSIDLTNLSHALIVALKLVDFIVSLKHKAVAFSQ